jgi:Prokaryotic Cytochrome C oxidase subunit IV
VNMKTLVYNNASVAWAALVALTGAAWALGAHAFGATGLIAGVLIIVVAVFKVRLIGLYFMELRDAPGWLRGGFEGYCIVLLALLSAMYLLAPQP